MVLVVRKVGDFLLKKLFLSFFSVFILALSLISPALASDAGVGEGETPDFLTPVVNVYNEFTLPDSEVLGEYVGSSVYSLNPVTPNDATGLKAVLLEFLGDWDSIVVEHAYQSSQGYTSYVREIQLDYPWLCSAALLVVMIFCLFRLGGSILCRK